MGRVYGDRYSGLGADPSAAYDPATWKDERMRAIIDDGQFQIAIEWRGCYGLPVHRQVICQWRSRVDFAFCQMRHVTGRM